MDVLKRNTGEQRQGKLKSRLIPTINCSQLGSIELIIVCFDFRKEISGGINCVTGISIQTEKTRPNIFLSNSMPVAREKGGRRRTASSSSDCGVLQSPPRSQFFAVDFESNDIDGDLASQATGDSALLCCSPKCSILSEAVDIGSTDSEVVKMVCSNDKCSYSPFMHASCFSSFEEQLLSFLRGMSRARNWSEKQRKQNLWTKKGYDLIFKVSTCRCSKGTLRKDLSYNGTAASGGGSASSEPTEKGKRRRKKSASGEKIAVPIRTGSGPQRTRSRTLGRANSDSLSSENGLVACSAPPALSGSSSSYMQPFVHRTDYTIFEKLVPRHLVNSYHIKMEDDGYGAGDDTRSFVLSSLALGHDAGPRSHNELVQ